MDAWEHLQPVIDKILRIDGYDKLSNLTDVERIVLLVWCYGLAICDGGHFSFFFNSYGRHSHQTVTALNQIGAHDYAKTLNVAIEQFPARHVPVDDDERNIRLGLLSESSEKIIENLDDTFFELGDENLMDLLLTFCIGSGEVSAAS